MDLESFWAEFAQHHWERQPLARDRVFPASPVTSEALFQTVVRCCDLQQGKSEVDVRFYSEGQQKDILQVFPLLPRAADGSFVAYHQRVLHELGGREYALVINNLEALDFPLWEWSCAFLHGLFRRVGLNQLGVYYALFVGNYRSTPFGVHRDPESVFHLPVVGHKAILTWPADYTIRNPGLKNAHQYGDFLDGSTRLDTGPGGLIYWPSGAWHVGEGDGQLAVSLALSLKCYADLLAPLLHQVLRQQPRSEAGPVNCPFDPDDLQSSAGRLPAALTEAASAVRAATSDAAMRILWLKTVSGFGFLYPPRPLADVALTPADVIRGCPGHPVLCVPLGDGELGVASCGHVLTCRDQPEVRTMIARLNEGLPQPIKRVLAECSRALPVKQTWVLLNGLYRFRAIQRLGPGE